MPESTDQVTMPLGEELICPLHPVYHGVRVEDTPREPRLADGRQVWLVTRYEDVKVVLASSHLAKDVRLATDLYNRQTGNNRPVIGGPISKHLLNYDPPDHTRLRKLVIGAFREEVLHARRPKIEAITKGLLDGLAGQDQIDLVTGYGLPFSVANICDMLGVPIGEIQKFAGWADALRRFCTVEEANDITTGMADTLRELIENKRQNPGEDLLTEVVNAHQAGELTDDELVAMFYVLIVAGYETSVNLIANGVLALLLHPEQLTKLRADPSLMPDAVDEILRYDGPAAMTSLRFTTAPIRLGSTVIPKGEFVLVSLRAANRDAQRFADPNKFDITRSAAGHLSFGHGIHYCLGAPMGRMEGEVAIWGLLERFPDLALGVEPEELVWLDGTMVHNLAALPVRLTRS